MKEIRSLVREVLSESFLNENDQEAKYLSSASEESQISYVGTKGYSFAIRYIENPSEAVQMAVAKVKAKADLKRWMED